MAGIKHVTVPRYNYQLELPDDFKDVLAIYRSDVIYIESFETWSKRFEKYIDQRDDEFYLIGMSGFNPFIKLRGYYSKWWIIRKFQQLADLYWPVKYKITYYSK